MSFSFKWPRFSDQFHETAIQLLNNALNKGNKPPVIADKIEVVELEMGTLVCFLLSCKTFVTHHAVQRDISDELCRRCTHCFENKSAGMFASPCK